MKKKFSKHWKKSKQPRKQRKYLANAPLHAKRKFLSVNLSRELRKKQKRRNAIPRKGDTVRIMRGKFKKKTGKIISIDVKSLGIKIEGITVKKRDGSKANVKIDPSNLQITEMNMEDKKRKVEKREPKEKNVKTQKESKEEKK